MESPATAMEAAAAEMHSAPCIGLGGDEGQGENAGDSSPEYPCLARNASVRDRHHCAPSCLGAPMANAMPFWLSEGVKVNVSAATVAGTVHLTVDT